MLPILAIALLVMALSPPGRLRPPLTRTTMPARGPLVTRSDHPEWRQLLINAALRRADELSQLRRPPDTPLHSEISKPDKWNIGISEPEKPSAENAETAAEIADVPPSRSDADPEDLTGTLTQSLDAAIPVGIGEASSTELPVNPQEEKPPAIRTPERSRPQHESMNVAPESAKPTQEQESVKAAPESNKLVEDNAKAAPERAKPAQESKKAERMPVKPERESRRRVHHRHYARVAEKPP
jgi:hypothetical protein